MFDKFQSGFQQNYSTGTAILKITNEILMSLDKGKYSI